MFEERVWHLAAQRDTFSISDIAADVKNNLVTFLKKERKVWYERDPSYNFPKDTCMMSEYLICLKMAIHKHCKWVRLPALERAVFYFIRNKLAKAEAAKKLYEVKLVKFIELEKKAYTPAHKFEDK